jgi:arginine N-succinyltransferase
MGKTHAEGELPFRVLADEGFESRAFIDIFDGGPILQAHRHGLRSFSASQARTVAALEREGKSSDAGQIRYLVATRRAENFRATMIDALVLDSHDFHGDFPLPEAAMRALEVGVGDPVLCVKL